MMLEMDEAFLSRRYYGGDLPAEAERALHAAALSYADDRAAEAFLARAAAVAPGHHAVDLGHYKFYLYKARLPEAMGYAECMLGHAARGLGLNHADWRDVTRRHADFDAMERAPRFFLFALKAIGYLHLRLGRLDLGRVAL